MSKYEKTIRTATVNRRRFTEILLTTASTAVFPKALLAATRPAADLMIEALRWSEDGGDTWHQGQVQEGGELLFQAEVRNTGLLGVPINRPVRVEFRVNDSLVDTVEHAAGMTANQGIVLTGATPWPADAGSYNVRARVDPGDLIPSEMLETNNQIVANLTVTAEPVVALAAAEEAEPHCPISPEQRKLAQLKQAKADRATWKAELKAEMKQKMVSAEGMDIQTAEQFAAAAVDGLSGLGSFLSTVAGVAIGATFATGPIAAPVAFGASVLAMALSPRALPGTNTMVGYSNSTGGNPGGFPMTIATLANTRLPGTTAARTEAALEQWGWAPTFKDPSGDFGNAKLFGTGGKIELYKSNSNRLRSIYFMYNGTMAWADAWNLSLFLGGFKNIGGGATTNGGHMDPNSQGTVAGLFYAAAMGTAIGSPAGIFDQPRLDHLYQCCLRLGFKNYPLRTGNTHGNIALGTLHHVSNLLVPPNLQPSPTNGDGAGAYNRNGILTALDYARQVGGIIPSITPNHVYTLVGNWARIRGIAIPTPVLVMLIKRILESFVRNGWKISQLADDAVAWLQTRSLAFSRDSIVRFITDVLLGEEAFIGPEWRRFFVHQLLSLMQSGGGTGATPRMIVTTDVKEATGTMGFEFHPAPTKAEYQQVTSIYDNWKHGFYRPGATIDVGTAGVIFVRQ